MPHQQRLEILGSMLVAVRTEDATDGEIRLWCEHFPQVKVICHPRQRHRGLVKLREGIEAMLWEKAAQGGYQAAV